MSIKYSYRYGGALIGFREIWAILKSVLISTFTGNWQANIEAKKMEEEAAAFLGVKHGILTTSGSCAGLLALEALELPKGSEVIIPAVTFPTIFNIILQCGHIPVVVDCEIGTYNISINSLKRMITKKTKAIIAVHAVGNPCNMPEIMRIARKHKIKVIEDSCDTWGGSINGKMIGSFGDISFTSFHAAHIVSMGVGGGVFTNSEKLAKNVRVYRDWGRQADTTKPNTYKTLPKDYNPRFIYEKIGYNFQILELQAAMGRVQLKKAQKIKDIRTKNFNQLVEGLSKYPLLLPPTVVSGADVCWFALPLTFVGDRGELIKHLEKHGIETRSMFAGNITRHPAYKYIKLKKDSLVQADFILEHSFWIGVHPRYSKKDIKKVLQVFDTFFNENRTTKCDINCAH